MVTAPLLELRGVGVRYGAVEALAGANLAVGAGEAVALCGDNGAGKSTLVKVVAGAQPPTTGTMLVDGTPVRLSGPRDALATGIAAIYQDLALAPRLAVYQNIFLGAELLWSPLPGLRILDKPAMRRRARELLASLGIALDDMDAPVEALSGGQRQAVAISRALLWNARLVIMDEPTAALGVRETRGVLDLIRRLTAAGVAVLLVSHTMDDVLAVADRVVVLNHGRIVADRPPAGLDADALKHLIIGGARAA